MKLKRILCLAVSLAMVLSIVPAFGLTASAESETTQNIYLTNSFSIKEDGVVETNLRVFGSNSGGRRVSLLGITIPELKENEEITSAVLVMTTCETSNGDTEVYVDDASSIWTNESTSATWATVGNSAALGDEITSTLVKNSGAGQVINFDITSFVQNKVASGNNFISLRMYNFLDSGNRSCVGFYPASNAEYKPYLILKTVLRADVTVNYVNENGAALGSFFDTAYVGDSYTPGYVNNDNYIVIENETADENGVYGYLAKLVSSDTITVAESGNSVQAVVKPVYQLKSANLLPDGEDVDNWTVGTSNADFSTQTISVTDTKVTESTEQVHSGSVAVKSAVGWSSYAANGWYGNCSIAMYADVNPDSTYYFAGAFYPGKSGGTEATIATLTTAGDPTTMQGWQDTTTELTNGGVTSWNKSDSYGAGKGKLFTNMNGKWNQLEYILTTDSESKGFAALFYYLNDAGTSYFDDFMLYEIEPAVQEHNVTVKYQYNGADVDNGSANVVLSGLEGTTVTAPAKTVKTDTAVYYFDAQTFTVGNADTEEVNTASRVVKVENGLIANYNFADVNSPASDAMGNYSGTNHGVVVNENGIATFEGGNKLDADAIELPASLLKELDGNFTISMWAKQDTSDSNYKQNISFFDLAYGDTYNHVYFQMNGGTSINLEHRGGSSSNDNRATEKATLGSAVFADEWDFVTISFDFENGTVSTYINGEKVETTHTNGDWSDYHTLANMYSRKNASDTVYPTLGKNIWLLNGQTGAENTAFAGEMAAVKVYNYAVTADEAATLNADAHKTVTVSYVADGEEIATATTVDYFTSEAAFDLPTTITKDGAVYALTGVEYDEAEASVTVTSSETEYTAQYESTEAVATGYEEIAAVTVIDGNRPVLPETVTLTTNKATVTYEAKVTWNTDSLTVGTNTVKGIVEGYDIVPEVSVTVLKCDDDSLAETFNATKGSSVKTFNVSATAGTVVYEFDAVFNVLHNSTISIGDTNGGARAPAFGWGGDAISIQTNTAGINVRSWSGSTPTTTSTEAVKIGETYRFFITANLSNKTWTAVMTDESGKQTVIANNNGYRNSDIDALDGIAVFDYNNSSTGDNAVADAITISNFRIYWPSGKDYTVNYTSSDGVINDTVTAKYVEGTQYGYDNEVIFPNVEIKSYDGYVFHTKTVSGDSTNGYTVTLTYEKASEDSFFLKDVPTDRKIIDLKLVGAHDALTSAMTGKGDAANVSLSNKNGSADAFAAISGSAAVYTSKTQSKDAYELLEEGVRFFDIRLSRSSTNATAVGSIGVASKSVPHTNGVFYTTHGLLGDEFRPLAYTIAQWAAAHPGEIIVLDFQAVADTTKGSGNGNATQDTWKDINSILEETGLNSLAKLNNSNVGGGGLANSTIASLTDEGEHAGVIILGQSTAGENNIGQFITRRNGNGDAFSGRLYSVYKKADDEGDTELSTEIGTSYNSDYIKAQYDYAFKFSAGDPISEWMLRVLQGQSESGTLLNQAPSDHKNLLADLKAHDEWLDELPIVLLDGVDNTQTNTSNLIEYIRLANIPEQVEVTLISSGTTVGTYTATVFGGDKVVVPAGIYAKQYYIDADTTATETDGVYSVEVSPLTLFTWEKSKNAALTTNGTYNAGRAVYWGENSGNRTGYAYVTVPETENGQSLLMTVDVILNNGYDRPNVPVVVFSTVDAEALKAIDLAGGADTTTALDALTATELVRTDVYTTIGSSANVDKQTEPDGELYSHAVITIPVSGLTAGDIAIKMQDDGAQSGIAVIKSISFEPAYTVTVYENGSSSVSYAAPGAELTIEAKGGIVAYAETDDDGNITKIHPTSEDGSLTITVTSDITLYAQTLGVSLVDGAQVRIGVGVTEVEDGYKIAETDSLDPTLASSGLRFIGIVDRNGSTLATVDGAEIGIEITAQNSETPIKVKAEKYQDPNKSVFTAALVNLKESNYNRVFTAKPYVTVNGVTYCGDTVSRSIYEIAAGILVDSTVEGTGEDTNLVYDTTAQVVNNVLNAYVNQVGIRLELTGDTENPIAARSSGKSGAYVGGKEDGPTIFFEVASTPKADGKYTVTITAKGDNTQLFGYWAEYIRLNNQSLSPYIDEGSSVSDDGKTLTLIINPSKTSTANE